MLSDRTHRTYGSVCFVFKLTWRTSCNLYYHFILEKSKEGKDPLEKLTSAQSSLLSHRRGLHPFLQKRGQCQVPNITALMPSEMSMCAALSSPLSCQCWLPSSAALPASGPELCWRYCCSPSGCRLGLSASLGKKTRRKNVSENSQAVRRAGST